MNNIIKGMLENLDINLLESKKLYLNGDLTDKYYDLLKKYKVLFEKFLLDKLPLKEYDDYIANSKLAFVAVDKGNMDFYQMFSSMELKYIYLRNNLYIEKLSLEDIDFLVNLSDKQLEKPDKKIFELIEKTYKSVIDCRTKDYDVVYKKCYGIDRDVFWINSDELVFGIRYDEFADNSLGDGKEWLDNYNEQLSLIGSLMEEMRITCSDILKINVKFLYYDEFSVKNSMVR